MYFIFQVLIVRQKRGMERVNKRDTERETETETERGKEGEGRWLVWCSPWYDIERKVSPKPHNSMHRDKLPLAFDLGNLSIDIGPGSVYPQIAILWLH